MTGGAAQAGAAAASTAEAVQALPPPPLPNDIPMPTYVPTRMGMDLGPPVYIYGSRTTHCDILCTTNTTKPAGGPPLDPQQHQLRAASDQQMLCMLPYEVANLLHLADSHMSIASLAFRTPLEIQQHTNLRVRKSRLFKRERRSFLRRLALARHDRFCLESLACIRIQAAFRGYSARLHLQARHLGLTEADLEARRALRSRRRREDVRPRTRAAQAEAERALFQAVVEEIRSASSLLGLPPIEGYTLPSLLAPTRAMSARRGRQRRTEIEDAAATMINKVVRGYLGRKLAARMEADRMSEHDHKLCIKVQSRWRGFRVRRDKWKLIDRTFRGAAVKIQSTFRGYRARKHSRHLRRLKSFEKRQALAAKRIQTKVKGFVSKKAGDEGSLQDDGSSFKRVSSMPYPSATQRTGTGRSLERKAQSAVAMNDMVTGSGDTVLLTPPKRRDSLDDDEAVVPIHTVNLSIDVMASDLLDH